MSARSAVDGSLDSTKGFPGSDAGVATGLLEDGGCAGGGPDPSPPPPASPVIAGLAAGATSPTGGPDRRRRCGRSLAPRRRLGGSPRLREDADRDDSRIREGCGPRRRRCGRSACSSWCPPMPTSGSDRPPRSSPTWTSPPATRSRVSRRRFGDSSPIPLRRARCLLDLVMPSLADG